MITPKCRTYVCKVNSRVFSCSPLVAFVAFAYHSISNRIAKKRARRNHSLPLLFDFRIIGSYVR